MMRLLDLFAGIGGFSLAAHWCGWKTVGFVEWDEGNQRRLKNQFPGIPVHNDVRTYHGIKGSADVICGGFPCQDLSSAGKGAGITGKKSGLWFDMLRIVRQVHPSFVVIENSPNLLKKGFESVLYPLSEIGYDAEWHVFQADDYGAWHQRKRVFIVAYPHGFGPLEAEIWQGGYRTEYSPWPSTSTFGSFDFGGRTYPQLPGHLLMDDGIPSEMGYVMAAGNAIVPQVAYQIFRAIQAQL